MCDKCLGSGDSGYIDAEASWYLSQSDSSGDGDSSSSSIEVESSPEYFHVEPGMKRRKRRASDVIGESVVKVKGSEDGVPLVSDSSWARKRLSAPDSAIHQRASLRTGSKLLLAHFWTVATRQLITLHLLVTVWVPGSG